MGSLCSFSGLGFCLLCLYQKLLALVEQHIRARPIALTSYRWRTIVDLNRFILNNVYFGVVELHPLSLALDEGVVVAMQHARTSVHYYTFKKIGSRYALSRLQSQLFWVRYPKR